MRRGNDLDNVDRQILALLEEDARRPNSEIARIVDLSPVTVAERIGRLRDIGVISKFTIKVDPAKIGYETAAMVRFEPSSTYHGESVRIVASHPAVRACYKVTGDSLLMLLVRVRNSAELNSVLVEFNQYGHTHTSVILTSELDERPWFAPGWTDPLLALTRRTRGY
ncbi:MAG TPA: Lrp/AsnC family transcriptional regulator [Sphingomicrobium sp.]|jgi:Lrp/AsnC family leucine-responsive transcriptional regulator|nr:Lrp/AsnC family transcriptional regulator [Sphingomicrobium sp.]